MHHRLILLSSLVLVAIITVPSGVHAHEQKDYTIILGENTIAPENATGLKVGDTAYFRMEDPREGSNHTVIVDTNLDGIYNESDWTSGVLTKTCEIDENGSKMDDSCEVDATLVFNHSEEGGTYPYMVEVNDGTIRYGNITIDSDEHDEGQTLGECTGDGCEDTNVDSQEGEEQAEYKTETSWKQKALLAIALVFGGVGVFLLMGGKKNEEYVTEEIEDKSPAEV